MNDIKLSRNEQKQILREVRQRLILPTMIGFSVATLLSVVTVMFAWWFGAFNFGAEVSVGVIALLLGASGTFYRWWWNWYHAMEKSSNEEEEFRMIEIKKSSNHNVLQPTEIGLPNASTFLSEPATLVIPNLMSSFIIPADLFLKIVTILTPILQDEAYRKHYWDLAFSDQSWLDIPSFAGPSNLYTTTTVNYLVNKIRTEVDGSQSSALSFYLSVILREKQGSLDAEPIKPILQLLNNLGQRSNTNFLDKVFNDSMNSTVLSYVNKLKHKLSKAETDNVDLHGRAILLEEHNEFMEVLDKYQAEFAIQRERIQLSANWCRQEGGSLEFITNVRERLLLIKRGVLLGEPGSGKSWALLRLAADYSNRYLNPSTLDEDKLIPIWIPLNKFTGLKKGIKQSFKEYIIECSGILSEYVETLWVSNRLILLCDALNEMPNTALDPNDPESYSRDLVGEIQNVLGGQAIDSIKINFILSCRVRNYKNDLDSPNLRPLEQVYLRDLTPPQIYNLLILRLGEIGRALWRDMGGTTELLSFWDKVIEVKGHHGDSQFWDRKTKWDAEDLRNVEGEYSRRTMLDHPSRLMLLCRSPFLAARICDIYLNRRNELHPQPLPHNRAELFQQLVSMLLQRESDNAQHMNQSFPAKDKIERALTDIADAMQNANRTTLPREIAFKAIQQRKAGTLIDFALSASILNEDGSDEKNITFAHQLFQEYFVAKKILIAFERLDDPSYILGEVWWDFRKWQEIMTILAEMGGGKERANAVARWLAPSTPEIALNVILQHGTGLTLDDVEEETRTLLISSAYQKTAELHPLGRTIAYRILGKFDADKRVGIGLYENNLPNIRWCYISNDSPVIIGSEVQVLNAHIKQEVEIPSFWMSKYLITNKQFGAFIDALDGYNNQEWWRDLEKNIDDAYNGRFNYSNHPREIVNWYQCVAFCRWLTKSMKAYAPKILMNSDLSATERVIWEYLQMDDMVIRLPTQYEWEKAARGIEGKIYPYGNNWLQEGGNVSDLNLDSTSAVGIFPLGDSPYEVSDMSGNVWEWTNSRWERSDGNHFILHGGSWQHPSEFANVLARFAESPINRGIFSGDYGLRVVLAKSLESFDYGRDSKGVGFAIMFDRDI